MDLAHSASPSAYTISRARAQVPVAPLVLEALQFHELGKTPKNERTERPIDWTVLVKVSATDSSKRSYQEGLIQEALYLLAEHLHTIAHSIAFPELVAPTVLALRALGKASKIVALQKRCKRLLAQIELQARYVSERRDAVDFAPSDEKAANGFLADEKAAGASPFSKWFASERAEQQRLEAQRQAEASERAAGIRVDKDEDDDDDDDDAGDDDDGAGAGDDDDGGEEDDDGDDDDDEGAGRRKKTKNAEPSKPLTKSQKRRAAKETSKAKRGAAAAAGDDGRAIPDEVGVLRMEDL